MLHPVRGIALRRRYPVAAAMPSTTEDPAAAAAAAAAADEGGVEKNPDMALADLRFRLASCEDKGDAKAQLMHAIKRGNMAPLYKACCEDLGWMVDDALLAEMEAANTAELERLKAAIKDAEDNLGSSEIREAYLANAEYLSLIGAKDKAVSALRDAMEKTSSTGQRMDITFLLCRLGMFWGDDDLVKRNIDKAEALLEEGGDWDRRNRLKVYKGCFHIASRDFKAAAEQLLSTVSTFTSTELLEYEDFVTLTVLSAIVAVDRPELKKKVVNGPEIQEVLHRLPLIKQFLTSLYDCDYALFFKSLAEVETQMKNHRIFAVHTPYYVREMRIMAYQQLLQSYRSVTLQSMALSFGVTPSFIDAELARFVAAGRLNCKIDMVLGVVETNRPDVKNAQYQECIKRGDNLLNRLQKLGQVINI